MGFAWATRRQEEETGLYLVPLSSHHRLFQSSPVCSKPLKLFGVSLFNTDYSVSFSQPITLNRLFNLSLSLVNTGPDPKLERSFVPGAALQMPLYLCSNSKSYLHVNQSIHHSTGLTLYETEFIGYIARLNIPSKYTIKIVW